MTSRPPRILVTGADQHQGLAVIRGLGRAGVHVIAAGSSQSSLGFYSRYTRDRACYRSPGVDPDGFIADMLAAIERTKPDLVMPAVESTLVALTTRRTEIEAHVPLAAPPARTLEFALDKRAAMILARQIGIRVPNWAEGDTVEAIMDRARSMTPPFVVKPRGHGGELGLPLSLDFKVRYAADLDALRLLLAPLHRHAASLLIQEYVPGIGRCVSGVWQHGRAAALFAYEREREVPVTGGVSVVRRSMRIDDQLETNTARLLEAIRWHGVAMVEYKYDRRTHSYTLMEINGRFQASTALAIDAGVNLPWIAARLHLEETAPAPGPYRAGVVERWLRGDALALYDVFARRVPHGVRWHTLWSFTRDFVRATRYDEFCAEDWVPAVVEAWRIAAMGARESAASVVRAVRSRGRTPARTPRPPVSASTKATAQRSMRA